jgi:hypothetical protein
MEAASSLPGGGLVGKVVFVILALVALYYLYQFLFGPTGLEGKIVLNAVTPASADQPIIVTGDQLPALYEGGEYTVNTWIYVNDYAVNRGMNKHILSIGGSSFLTLAVFLGPFKNTLSVRIHTKSGTGPTIGTASSTPADTGADLSVANLTNIFGNLQMESSLTDDSRPCDVSNLELQKWIQVTVTLNNKTCDVYIDGKLARSCVLPAFYKVDKNNLAMSICNYKGFGGFVSNTSAYNYALNPEQVWRLYMSGPGPQYTFWEYVKAMFDPKAAGAMDFPKQNITQ